MISSGTPTNNVHICLLFLCIITAVVGTQILEEVMLKHLAQTHQGFGINPASRKYQIDVVAMTIQLFGQPRDFQILAD